MKLFLFFILFISQFAFADGVKVVVDPKEPLLGESFNVTFKVVTKNGTDPIINFNPQGLEVISRQETGISTRTSYMNGQLSVERSISITYEMIANKSGSTYLKDINVELNGKLIKHPTVRIIVLKTARRSKDIMAIAIVDKESAFVGESILVRYYLYNKIQVNTTDIKRFPKLDKFLKRYHQEKMRAERVQYNGDIYTRRIIYTAQLFAEKAGQYKIDPITLNVQFTKRSSRYNNLGFGFGKSRSKSVTSKAILIEIKALPIENVPPFFTGLVGNHDFKLQLNRNKFVVNEPIEMKLTVKGEGALELYESPEILKNSQVEQFDTNSELVVASDFTATKTFNITYLGRESFSEKSKVMPFAFFDTQKMEYVTINLNLGSIVVAGGQQVVRSQGNKTEGPEDEPFKEVFKPKIKIDLTPIYKFNNSYLYNKKYIIIFLIFILIIVSGYKGIGFYKNKLLLKPELYKLIEKEGVDYGRLHKLISNLGQGTNMEDVIIKSKLTSGTKKYFLELIMKCEHDYKNDGKIRTYKLKKKSLVEIIELLNEKNEIS
jgi:hypothetical protein